MTATVLVILVALTYIVSRQYTGFIFNKVDLAELNIYVELFSVIAPLALWCMVNWAVTSVLEGKGNLKDIYVMSAYALTRIIINVPLVTHEYSFSKAVPTSAITLAGLGIVIFLGLLQFILANRVHTFIARVVAELFPRCLVSVPPGEKTPSETFSFSYFVPGGSQGRKSSYSDSVSLGQFAVEKTEGGVGIRYDLARRWKKEDALPVLIDQDRFEELILGRLSSKFDREPFLDNHFPVIAVPLEPGEDRVQVAGISDVSKVLGDYTLASPMRVELRYWLRSCSRTSVRRAWKASICGTS